MIAVIQRVSSASVRVDAREVARIGKGLLLLVGVKKGDTLAEAQALARKVTGLRLFSDAEGKMNRSILNAGIDGEILAVSQFTLLGDLKKGRRPSFDKAEHPDLAEPLFNELVQCFKALSVPIQTGIFGALMDVALQNEGPVTFVLDTDNLSYKRSPVS